MGKSIRGKDECYSRPEQFPGSVLDAADPDVLALQLTAALDAPLLLYLSGADDSPEVADRLGRGWEDLVRRVCRPGRNA